MPASTVLPRFPWCVVALAAALLASSPAAALPLPPATAEQRCGLADNLSNLVDGVTRSDFGETQFTRGQGAPEVVGCTTGADTLGPTARVAGGAQPMNSPLHSYHPAATRLLATSTIDVPYQLVLSQPLPPNTPSVLVPIFALVRGQVTYSGLPNVAQSAIRMVLFGAEPPRLHELRAYHDATGFVCEETGEPDRTGPCNLLAILETTAEVNQPRSEIPHGAGSTRLGPGRLPPNGSPSPLNRRLASRS